MVRGVVAAALALLAITACGDSQIHTTGAKVPLAKGASAAFDDVEIDQATQTVYAADRANSGVDVFDVAGHQPHFLATITLPARPNGLAIDPTHGRLFAGVASGAVEVIDTTRRKLVSEIKTSAREIDLLEFAGAQNWLLASTGAGGTVLTIDAATGKVIATASVGKPVEQPRYDPANGRAYVSAPDLDALAVIDPQSGAIKQTMKLGGCIPVGLAIRPSTSTAVVACRKSVIAYDLRSGQKTDLGARGAGGDIVQYFPGVDRFFVIARHSSLPSVVAVFGGDPVAYIGSVNLDGGGNAAVYDERTDNVFTTDERSGSAGLTGLQMDGTRPAPMWHTAMFVIAPLAVFLLVLMALWWFIGRHSDPIHRKVSEQRAA